MITEGDRAGLLPVSDETRGHGIKRRREALGMSVSALAKKVGMDRGTLARAEEGDERTEALTYSRIEGALDRLETEMGIDQATAEDDVVEFRLSGNFGVDVVVKGPVANLAELEGSISRLLREMRDHGE